MPGPGVGRKHRGGHAPAKKKKSPKQRRREDLPPNFWKGGKRTLDVGREEFHVVGIRGDGSRVVLDDVITSLGWEDAGVYLAATMSATRAAHRNDNIGLGMGNQVQVYVSPWGQRHWKPLWRARVINVDKELVDGTVNYELADDAVLLGRSRMDFKYKKAKGGPHKKGWRCDQIASDALSRAGVKHGVLYRGKTRITNLVKHNASPLDLIMQAYRKERQKTGTRFVVRMDNGKLTVRPLLYSRYLYEIGDLVAQAAVNEQMRGNMATVLNVRATSGKKKHKKKIRLTVSSPTLTKRYGRIERDIHVDADSPAEARREAKRMLAKRALPKREVTFTHPGIANLRRGHALRLYFPHEELKQVCFVKEVRHSVTPGDFSSEVTVRFDDPYEDYREEKAKRKRCAAAKAHGRKPADDCPKTPDRKKKKAKPKKAARRADK